GFEDRDRLAVRSLRVDDGRHAVVGGDLEEVRLELLALADIDEFHLIGSAEFLQHDGNLPAIGRWPVIQFDRLGPGGHEAGSNSCVRNKAQCAAKANPWPIPAASIILNGI